MSDPIDLKLLWQEQHRRNKKSFEFWNGLFRRWELRKSCNEKDKKEDIVKIKMEQNLHVNK